MRLGYSVHGLLRGKVLGWKGDPERSRVFVDHGEFVKGVGVIFVGLTGGTAEPGDTFPRIDLLTHGARDQTHGEFVHGRRVT